MAFLGSVEKISRPGISLLPAHIDTIIQNPQLRSCQTSVVGYIVMPC